MTATMKVRKWWASYRCIHTAEQPKVKARIWDRNRGWTPTGCIEAWSALEAALTETGYGTPKRAWVDRKCPIGIEGRPCQKSGVDCSLHNYGLAIDIDPAKNPHFQQRFGKDWNFSDVLITRSQVEAVEAIKTDSGVQVFKWLGWSIGDTMHFEITCRPEDLASGVPFTGSGARLGKTEKVESKEEEDVFTADEEKFLKNLFKVVVEDMDSSASFARSAILDIRKDIITRGELIAALKDLPSGDVDAAIAEVLRRLKA